MPPPRLPLTLLRPPLRRPLKIRLILMPFMPLIKLQLIKLKKTLMKPLNWPKRLMRLLRKPKDKLLRPLESYRKLKLERLELLLRRKPSVKLKPLGRKLNVSLL